ncbi:MAG: DUF2336 domain-containing protein [Alphaproteobacteria bacterium]
MSEALSVARIASGPLPVSTASIDSEVGGLLALAAKKNRQGRADLFTAISDLFERRGNTLKDAERDLMLDILQRLTGEVERAVRSALARRVAENERVPPELLTLLANDEIEVAYPILAQSALLRDPDLIEIIRHRSMQHQLAVSVRRGLSEKVSSALVESGNEDVIVSLLNNPSARLGDDVMQHLVEESRRVDRFQRPLVGRDDLPEALAKKMCAWVSAALRQHIVQHYEIDVGALDDQLSGLVSDGAAMAEPTEAALSAAQRLVDKLHVAGELTPRFVIKSLSQGQITLFELALAKLTGIPTVLVRRIAYEPGGEGLAVACCAIGIDRAAFVSVYRLTRKALNNGEELDQVGLRRLVKFYDATSREAAEAVVAQWARDEDYNAALASLDGLPSA